MSGGSGNSARKPQVDEVNSTHGAGLGAAGARATGGDAASGSGATRGEGAGRGAGAGSQARHAASVTSAGIDGVRAGIARLAKRYRGGGVLHRADQVDSRIHCISVEPLARGGPNPRRV